MEADLTKILNGNISSSRIMRFRKVFSAFFDRCLLRPPGFSGTIVVNCIASGHFRLLRVRDE